MTRRNMTTSQCPFCFYTAPLPGFEGVCPKCGKDTTKIIGCLRYDDPDTLSGDDAEAAYRLQRISAGMEPPQKESGV